MDPLDASSTDAANAATAQSGNETSSSNDEADGEESGKLFCGLGEFTWYKGPYKGRMHRVVQVSIMADKLDIEHYYSGRFVGYHKELRRGISFNLNNETGQYEFDRTGTVLPMLIIDEARTTLVADFQSDRQSLQLTEATCSSTPYSEDLAAVRRR